MGGFGGWHGGRPLVAGFSSVRGGGVENRGGGEAGLYQMWCGKKWWWTGFVVKGGWGKRGGVGGGWGGGWGGGGGVGGGGGGGGWGGEFWGGGEYGERKSAVGEWGSGEFGGGGGGGGRGE